MPIEDQSYEVQTYRNGKWSIALVSNDKDSAVFEAQRRLQSPRVASVRVVHEVYDANSDSFRSRVVFRRERGDMVGEREEEKPEEKAVREKGDKQRTAGVPDKSREKKKRSPMQWTLRVLFGVLFLAGAAAGLWRYLIYEPAKPPPVAARTAPPRAVVGAPPRGLPGESEPALPGDAGETLLGKAKEMLFKGVQEALPMKVKEGYPKVAEGTRPWKGAKALPQRGGTQPSAAAGPVRHGVVTYYTLEPFNLKQLRDRKVSMDVTLVVALDVVGQKGLMRVERKVGQLHKAIYTRLSQIVTMDNSNLEIFRTTELSRTLKTVCDEELGPGFVRDVLIRTSWQRY